MPCHTTGMRMARRPDCCSASGGAQRRGAGNIIPFALTHCAANGPIGSCIGLRMGGYSCCIACGSSTPSSWWGDGAQ
eukprot:6548524-Pyramimonas_sp.AAC.1